MHTKNAYVIIHFGVNPKYLELELFFLIMLKKHTTYDIVYMYSSADTPKEFVRAVRALGGIRTRVFNDRGITFDVPFPSIYSNFNILRTCDFIFAYLLTQYTKVCIIEADMVIMRNIDDIFTMNTPAIVYYNRQHPELANTHYRIDGTGTNIPDVLKECEAGSSFNGGIIVIEPSRKMYSKYIAALPVLIAAKCKYPNETLFKYVNGGAGAMYYNLPVKYNSSHYHLKRLVGAKAAKEPLRLSDVAVVHFNETQYKHLDIIKSPVDEAGVDWLSDMLRPEGHHPKHLPMEYYYRSVYLPNVELVDRLMRGAKGAPIGRRTPRKRCPNGTRKNRKTGECIHGRFIKSPHRLPCIHPHQYWGRL